MPVIAGASLLPQAQHGFVDQYEAELLVLIRALQGILTQNATLSRQDNNQTIYSIPRSNEARVLQTTGDSVQRFFVGPDFRSAYAADGETPLAPYPALLNHWLAWVTFSVVAKHTAFMKKHLPRGVQNWLLNGLAQADPFTFVGQGVTLGVLSRFDTPHNWLDPRGLRLSDRIWQTSLETRRKIDALLADGIRHGRSAADMAKDLETFLLPSRAGLKGNKSYGTRASFAALRLAKNELKLAHSRTTIAVARANPFVGGVDWRVAARHVRFDDCDRLATIGVGGQRLKAPYPVDGRVPLPGRDSHILCECFLTVALTEKGATVADQLRGMLDRHEAAPLTPMDSFRFVKRLVGTYLASLVFAEVSPA